MSSCVAIVSYPCSLTGHRGPVCCRSWFSNHLSTTCQPEGFLGLQFFSFLLWSILARISDRQFAILASGTVSEGKQPYLRAKKLFQASPRRPALDRLRRTCNQTKDQASEMDQASGMAQHPGLLAAVSNLTLEVQRLTSENSSLR